MLRKAVIAAVVGGTCGAVAALWSLPARTRNEPVAVAAAPAAIAASTATAVPASPVSRPAEAPAPVQPQPQAKQQTMTEPASRRVDDAGDAVQRARVLAQKPDVTSLVALREAVLRRAEEAGGKDSPATKQQLDEIDCYLTEARLLRLKLDAAEFRKSAAEGIPPR